MESVGRLSTGAFSGSQLCVSGILFSPTGTVHTLFRHKGINCEHDPENMAARTRERPYSVRTPSWRTEPAKSEGKGRMDGEFQKSSTDSLTFEPPFTRKTKSSFDEDSGAPQPRSGKEDRLKALGCVCFRHE